MMIGEYGPPFSEEELDAAEARIDAWLAAQKAENPVIAAIDRGEPGERRWYVRITGEEKSVSAIWFRLGQRNFHYETYVIPAPEENEAMFYEHFLRRNYTMKGLQFAIGPEDAIYLMGAMPIAHVDEAAIDWIIGSVYETVERCFRPALRIGFASRFAS